MVQRRVLIISDHTLFAEGVRSLVEETDDLEVVDIVSGSGDVLVAEVERCRPDVIILDDAADTRIGFFSQLVDVAPGVRIILTSLEDSTVEVYDGRKVVAGKGQDLVDAVRRVNNHHRS